MTDFNLYAGDDWAEICDESQPEESQTIAKFFGASAGVTAQVFMEKLAVIDSAKQFVADYLAALNEAEISPNGDDFNALCDGMLDILAFNPAPSIDISEDNR